MPRLIAEIAKELKAKQDLAAKNEAAIDKRTEEKKKQASIISSVRPDISKKEITIGTIEKSLKDPKTKKEHRPGLEAQKKKTESELAPLRKKLDAALEEHDVCAKILETLAKTDQPLAAAITKLAAELKTAKEGQVNYGKSRAKFKAAYTIEMNRMLGWTNAIKVGHENVAKLLAATEAAAEKNDLDAAQGYAKQAKIAAEKNRAELEKLEAHQAIIRPAKDEQRNLAPSEFDILPADTQVHAALNREALAMFAEEDKIAAKARARVKESDEDAEEAAHRAAEGARTVQNMSASLGRSLTALKAIDAGIQLLLGSTWGKQILNQGELFTRYTADVKAVPPKPIEIPLKTYEQASIYVDEAYARLQRFNLRMQAGAKKAIDAVPVGLRGELTAEIAPIQKLAHETNVFFVGCAPKVAKANAELDKLKAALDARM